MPDFDYTMEKLSDDLSICVTKDHRFGTDAFLLSDLLASAAKTLPVTLEPAVVLFRCCGFGTDLRLLKKHMAWIFRSLQ